MKFIKSGGQQVHLADRDVEKLAREFAQENGMKMLSKAEFESLEALAAGKSGAAIAAATKELEAENAKLRAENANLRNQSDTSKGKRILSGEAPTETTEPAPRSGSVDELRARLADETDPTKKANLAREIRKLASRK